MRLAAALKSLAPWARRPPLARPGRQPSAAAYAPGARVSHASLAGPAWQSATVAIAANWVARVWNEAPFVAETLSRSGWERSPGHELERLASSLAWGMSDSALWSATVADLLPLGNAFWLVGARRDGSPAAWPVRAWNVSVEAGKDGLPAAFKIRTAAGGEVVARPEEVWHFRTGVDPTSPLLGASPLANLLRERAQENAAAEYTLGLCRGFGAAGAVFKAAPGTPPPNPREMETLASAFREVFTLDGAGGALILPPGLELEFPGASPEDMALGELASAPTSRILAALGLSPMAVGLPDPNKTYSNLAEALDSAWENCVLPMKRACAETLTERLGAIAGAPSARLVPDASQVRALAEDETRQASRAARLYAAGVVDRATAQRLAGLEPSPGSEGVYANDLAPVGQGSAKALVAKMIGSHG